MTDKKKPSLPKEKRFYSSQCTECDGKLQVTDSRLSKKYIKGAIKRRRKCLDCGYSFTTYEVSLEEAIKLKNGTILLERLTDKAKELSRIVERVEDLAKAKG